MEGNGRGPEQERARVDAAADAGLAGAEISEEALRKAEGSSVDDTVCPSIAPTLQFIYEEPHSGALLKLQQEGDVFHNQPTGSPWGRVE